MNHRFYKLYPLMRKKGKFIYTGTKKFQRNHNDYVAIMKNESDVINDKKTMVRG